MNLLLMRLAGARVIKVDPEKGLVYTNFGSTGINVYDEKGHEVDYFTVADNDPDYVEQTLREMGAK